MQLLYKVAIIAQGLNLMELRMQQLALDGIIAKILMRNKPKEFWYNKKSLM